MKELLHLLSTIAAWCSYGLMGMIFLLTVFSWIRHRGH